MNQEQKEDLYRQILPTELFIPLNFLALQTKKPVADLIEDVLAVRVGITIDRSEHPVDTNSPLYRSTFARASEMGLSPDCAARAAKIAAGSRRR